MPDEHPTVPQGTRLRLKCTTDECWVDDIEVKSRGGIVQQSPTCPHCRLPVTPQDDGSIVVFTIDEIASDQGLWHMALTHHEHTQAALREFLRVKATQTQAGFTRLGYPPDPRLSALLADVSIPDSEVP